MSKKRDKLETERSERLAHHPFAALAGSIAELPRGADEHPPEGVEETPSGQPKLDGKLVVRRENKGRGGKTVTRIAGLAPEDLEALAARMKKALGCGATVVDGDLMLLGNVQDRAIEWLSREGARRVVRGN